MVGLNLQNALKHFGHARACLEVRRFGRDATRPIFLHFFYMFLGKLCSRSGKEHGKVTLFVLYHLNKMVTNGGQGR